MNSKQILLNSIFFAVSLLHLTGIIIHNALLQAITKPLLMPVLLTVYIVSVSKINKWYTAALLFAFLGDVFLMDKDRYFIIGIALFLVTQLMYIKIISSRLRRSTGLEKTLAILPFVLYYVLLITSIKKNLNELLLPVMIYGLVISVFGILATLNYVTSRTKNTLLLFSGAVIFIASDSMIALNSFYRPQPYYGFLIMFTYIAAQYLIFRYMIQEKSSIY